MDLRLPEELAEYGRTAADIAAHPDVAPARYGPQATTEARALLVQRLEAFGLFDLQVSADAGELLIAGTVLRALGRAGAGLPFAAMITGRAAALDGLLHTIGHGDRESIILDGRDLGGQHWTVDVHGTLRHADGEARPSGDRVLARFAAPVELGDPKPGDQRWWALHEVLAAFLALGVAEQALAESRRHLNEREQFGKPLKAFQALAHRFAEMVVASSGLEELCLYSAWAHHARAEQSFVDALALRLHALDVLLTVERSAHQIHAAMGFCHEHPLADLTSSTWLWRTQPLPASAVAELLAERAGEFELLFSDEPSTAAHATVGA